MINISDSKKIIIYIFLGILVLLFFVYFFRQSSVPENIESVSISPSSVESSIDSSVEINLDFFQSDKFQNLRSDKMPAVVFPVGKRDPFVKMEESE